MALLGAVNQKFLICYFINNVPRIESKIFRLYLTTSRWTGHVVRMEEGRSAFKILTGSPSSKIPLERPWRRWEDNTRMDLDEIGIDTRNWVDSVQDRNYWRALVNEAFNLRIS